MRSMNFPFQAPHFFPVSAAWGYPPTPSVFTPAVPEAGHASAHGGDPAKEETVHWESLWIDLGGEG